MESEIAQLKKEIEQLKKEKKQMKKKIERLAVKNAETKMDCIRNEDKSTFIVEINVVEDHTDPIKLPVLMYVKSYCSDEPNEKKENVEGKTYYITCRHLPSAHVFAKYAWKRLCGFIRDWHAGCFDDEETMLIPVYYEHICPELVNDFIPRLINDFEGILMEEKSRLGWYYYEDNISDSDFEYDDITDSEDSEDSEDEDEDEGIDWSECVDECVDECDDEECASIDLTNINRPAC